jgi:hypothetical protein
MTATLEAPDAAEPISRAGLCIDLMMSELARRVAVCRAVGGLLGPSTLDKVWTRWNAVDAYQRRLEIGHADGSWPDDPGQRLLTARDLLAAVAQLEDSLFSLTSAAAKKGLAK